MTERRMVGLIQLATACAAVAILSLLAFLLTDARCTGGLTFSAATPSAYCQKLGLSGNAGAGPIWLVLLYFALPTALMAAWGYRTVRGLGGHSFAGLSLILLATSFALLPLASASIVD
jgi:hypothetical protein